MKIPTKEQCLKMLEDNKVPPNIIAHAKKVCEVALLIAAKLEKKGIKANKKLVMAAALLHDIEKLKPDHVVAGAEFVREKGFKEVAGIIEKHGLQHLDNKKFMPSTAEEKIVFYADKRVNGEKIVSIGKRFRYIKEKYSYLSIDKEYEVTKKIEEELLDNGKRKRLL